MTRPLKHRGRHLALLLCLLGGTSLPLTAALAGPSIAAGWSDLGADRSGADRHRNWLNVQRSRAEQAYQQTQRRLDELERCLDRSRRSQERDQCLRRDLEARERQWQRDQRDWQLLLRRQARIAQLLDG